MCLPCFGGAADDVVVTPDPVSNFSHPFLKLCVANLVRMVLILSYAKQ